MEWRLFPEGTVPEHTTPAWYADRDRARHIDEPVHQGRLWLAAEMVNACDGHAVVDLGAGDGGLLTLIDPGHFKWGYDLQPSNVAGARERGQDVSLGNVLVDQIVWARIVVVTEMLEHLVDPHGFLASMPRSVGSVVASSPFTETDESHYAYHTYAWDMDGYRALFENAGWIVVDHRTDGFMFQVLRAVRP